MIEQEGIHSLMFCRLAIERVIQLKLKRETKESASFAITAPRGTLAEQEEDGFSTFNDIIVRSEDEDLTGKTSRQRYGDGKAPNDGVRLLHAIFQKYLPDDLELPIEKLRK